MIKETLDDISSALSIYKLTCQIYNGTLKSGPDQEIKRFSCEVSQ